MITNFKEKTKKIDIKILTSAILVFVVLVWLFTPPGNKFLQVCFWGNNTRMILSKIKREDNTEYLFHRNNAIYLAKMYPKGNKKAIEEMNMAIAMLPAYAPEAELKRLYAERAQINMYLGNYKQALSDYMNSGEIKFEDYIKVALLYRVVGNNKEALSYCNQILNTDITAFAGYACLADLYDNMGRTDMAVKVWTVAIERKRNPKSYLARAKYRKKLGDEAGAKKDINSAKELAPSINTKDSYIDEILNPRILTISIR